MLVVEALLKCLSGVRAPVPRELGGGKSAHLGVFVAFEGTHGELEGFGLAERRKRLDRGLALCTRRRREVAFEAVEAVREVDASVFRLPFGVQRIPEYGPCVACTIHATMCASALDHAERDGVDGLQAFGLERAGLAPFARPPEAKLPIEPRREEALSDLVAVLRGKERDRRGAADVAGVVFAADVGFDVAHEVPKPRRAVFATRSEPPICRSEQQREHGAVVACHLTPAIVFEPRDAHDTVVARARNGRSRRIDRHGAQWTRGERELRSAFALRRGLPRPKPHDAIGARRRHEVTVNRDSGRPAHVRRSDLALERAGLREKAERAIGTRRDEARFVTREGEHMSRQIDRLFRLLADVIVEGELACGTGPNTTGGQDSAADGERADFLEIPQSERHQTIPSMAIP